MGYFGGLGAGKGWHKFQFLVCPQILRQVLTHHELWLVINNRRVTTDYQFTSIDDYVDAYTGYLEASMAAHTNVRQAASNIYIGMVTSLDTLTEEICPEPRFKLLTLSEPAINLNPVMLHYDGERLSTHMLSDIYFGLEMSFPKVVSFADDGHQTLYDTAPGDSFKLFESMKSEFKALTKPCKIRSLSRDHRTAVRIDPAMRNKMANHAGLKSLNLQIL